MTEDEELDIMRVFQQEIYASCHKRIKHIDFRAERIDNPDGPLDNESDTLEETAPSAKEVENSLNMCAGVLLKTAIELYTIGLPDGQIVSMLDLAKESIPQLRDNLDLKAQTMH
jgi:hypothetical protein